MADIFSVFEEYVSLIDEANQIKNIYLRIGALILVTAPMLLLIALIIYLIISSAKCPLNTVDFLEMKRDLLDITREYTIYNKKEDELIRIEGKFPQKFTMEPKSNKFIELQFNEKTGGLSPLPSYDVYDHDGNLVAEIKFRIDLSNKYLIKYYKDKNNVIELESQKNIYSSISKSIPNEFSFYYKGSKDKVAFIKRNELKFKVTYNFCLQQKITPILKQILVASAVALDQHEK